MINIRQNVFETNSSSSHSVSIYNTSKAPSTLRVEDYYDCEVGDSIVVELCGFCSNGFVNSQNDKLAYLILQIAYITGTSDCIGYSHCYEEKVQELYDTDEFKELEEEICEYTQTAHLRIDLDSGGYIDHESVCGDIDELKNYELEGYGYSSFVFGDSDVFFEHNG